MEGSLGLYGIDLDADFWHGPMTLRKLWVRVRALPPECLLWREVHEAAEVAKAEAAERSIDETLAMVGGARRG